MGIERDRIGQLDPGQRSAASLAQTGERSIRAVDVKPDLLRGGRSPRSHAAGRRRRLPSCPRWRRPCRGRRPSARSAAMAPLRASERMRTWASVGITRTWPGRKPSARAARATDSASDRTGTRPPGRPSRRYGPRARRPAPSGSPPSPRDEHAGGLLGIAHPLPEPVEHHELQCAAARKTRATSRCRR